MIYQKETNIGQIAVEKNALIQIIYKAVEMFEGKVIIGNYSKSANKLYYKMGASAENSAIEIARADGGIDIKICIMVKFGTSISKATKSLIASVNAGVKQTFGEEPGRVEVIITGVISKNVGTRNIKVIEKR